ncbi:hypothetical protein MINS_03910 [Mycolicibacterium insubricum]|uniref:Uncharacterized protein n=1 Tax=Mycolicibacterium insubricum TaxID=444597 RepID=A0A1X0CZ37_9MYCO|nr:hypothetical protein [Mycolicibacterium insubricum]MCV7082888.1 hypothetical protein [Mycolicibacterium insubricum]ORA65192.1 hypothetical protein BST26_19090 [Mycolicibacterium insubricum]BBZ64962.1 hypothetical protein MINS_03910 [Mycolicibacterium insubricum]
MTGHACDPHPDPRGGYLTQTRVLRVLIEGLKREDGDWLPVIDEVYGCLVCTIAFVGTLAGFGGNTFSAVYQHDGNALLALELQLAAVEAEMRSGQTGG